jgi:hypothetical protein
MKRSTHLAFLVSVGVLAFSAQVCNGTSITSVVISGPGGTGSSYIDNSNDTVPSAYFTVTFTQMAPIDFAVTIDSPGFFYLTANNLDSILNDTGQNINALEMQLLDPPADAERAGGQYGNAHLPTPIFPSSYAFALTGTPALADGDFGGIGLGFDIPDGTGPITLDIELTPYITSVPEPTSLVSSGMGTLTIVGCLLRRRPTGRPARAA